MKDNYIVQAWLILALAVSFAAALSGIEIALADRIEANKIAETRNQIPELVRSVWWDPDPAGKWTTDKNKTEEWVTSQGHLAYKAYDSEGNERGWVIKAAGSGFADRIEVLIGLDVKGDIVLGLYVLDQKETPALGNRIKEPQWRRKFAGLDASRDVVISTSASERAATIAANSVQAVTGATVSSKSVAAIVNAAVKDFRNRIGDLKKK